MIDKAKVENQGATEEKPERLAKNIMRPRSFDRAPREVSEYEEKVIEVRRVARTVKGGRRIRFRALVVIGNRKGKVGVATAKANDVTEAVKKAVSKAKKSIVFVPIIDGTIPYAITSKYGSAVVMLKPAASGTSIVAGGSVRAVAELSGITDLLSKMMGSSSKVNNLYATIQALSSFKEDYIKKVKDLANRRKTTPVEEKVVESDMESVSEDEKSNTKKPKSALKKTAMKSMKK